MPINESARGEKSSPVKSSRNAGQKPARNQSQESSGGQSRRSSNSDRTDRSDRARSGGDGRSREGYKPRGEGERSSRGGESRGGQRRSGGFNAGRSRDGESRGQSRDGGFKPRGDGERSQSRDSRDGGSRDGQRRSSNDRNDRNDRNDSPRGERSGSRDGESRGGQRRSGGYRGRDNERSGSREGGFRARSGGPHAQRGGRGGGFSGGRGGGGGRGRSGGGGGRGGRFANTKALDVNLFMNDVVEIKEEEKVAITNTFADFGFVDQLEANIVKKGYVTPTPIQDQTIHFALEGKDVLGMANTGTGKTAAFTLPIINELAKIGGRQETRALVIAPTRELAQQIEQEFRTFTPNMKLFSTLCVGGLSIHKQKIQLKRHPHVVIGTPGRLKDLWQQGVLDLSRVSMFVLDEVDLMLDMGFIDDIQFLVAKIPVNRQTFCFSATMTNTIKRLVESVMNEPVQVSVKTGDTSANVQQDIVYASNSKDKWDKLIDMFGDQKFEKILIFCETKSFVQRLSDDLNDAGVRTEAIHGDKSQPQRQKALRRFKDDTVQVLVATDVAARGLDIPDVSHVINYDTPRVYEDYVHRIGRTGRAGKLGNAITFVKS